MQFLKKIKSHRPLISSGRHVDLRGQVGITHLTAGHSRRLRAWVDSSGHDPARGVESFGEGPVPASEVHHRGPWGEELGESCHQPRRRRAGGLQVTPEHLLGPDNPTVVGGMVGGLSPHPALQYRVLGHPAPLGRRRHLLGHTQDLVVSLLDVGMQRGGEVVQSCPCLHNHLPRFAPQSGKCQSVVGLLKILHRLYKAQNLASYHYGNAITSGGPDNLVHSKHRIQ
mmetsp:Transcript_116215/g.266783  ORF Transcript_116215/g.266783 Transcript_116215/m.266783 type:complete len:226 (+) Transcript_116215:878-1555(+)